MRPQLVPNLSESQFLLCKNRESEGCCPLQDNESELAHETARRPPLLSPPHPHCDILTVTVSLIPLLLLVFRDTAGQERFRTITTAYYRGAMVWIGVFVCLLV